MKLIFLLFFSGALRLGSGAKIISVPYQTQAQAPLRGGGHRARDANSFAFFQSVFFIFLVLCASEVQRSNGHIKPEQKARCGQRDGAWNWRAQDIAPLFCAGKKLLFFCC